ncbi:TPA: Rha family transcriptional regulator [Yersinia enterocolitica]|nr:Rha family transcriptional regulator [Yersinia enterocolitica]
MRLQNTPLQGRGFVRPENGQADILVQHKHEQRIDSRLFAERIGIKHKNLYALIQKHKSHLRELGSLPAFETEAVKKRGARGIKYERYHLLNSDQFDYICRIVRGRDAVRMNQFKLDVTKAFAKRRAIEPVRREYLPGYHESREGLKALGAQPHHFINLARAENRITGLRDGERRNANEQQLGLLVVMQKIERAAFDEAIQNGMTPTEAVREVARRMETFASLMTSSPSLDVRQ